MKKVDLKIIANRALAESNNPLGVDYELNRYTMFRGVRLERYKKRPDRLVFLQRVRNPNEKLLTPVIHMVDGVLFKYEPRPRSGKKKRRYEDKVVFPVRGVDNPSKVCG